MPTMEKADLAWQKELEQNRGTYRPHIKRQEKIFAFEMLRNKLSKDKNYSKLKNLNIKNIKKTFPDKIKDIGFQIAAVIQRIQKIYLKNKSNEKNKEYLEMMDLFQYWRKIGYGKRTVSLIEGYNRTDLKTHLMVLASLERKILKDFGYHRKVA